MNIQIRRKPIEIISVPDSKFKNVTLSLRLFKPLEKIENTKLALLSFLVKDRNEKYSTKKEIRQLKDNLYGASFRTSLFGYGPLHALELRLTAISENTVNESLQLKQLQALKDFLYYPLLNQETLNEAKINLTSKLYRQNENPMNTSIKRSFEILGKDTNLAVSTQGDLDDIENVSLADMVEFHRDLIEKVPMILFVIGDFNQSLIEAINTEFVDHQSLPAKAQYNVFNSSDSLEVSETSLINQASLVMSYQTNRSIEDDTYYALRLGSLILGQLPTSLLFQEVREKASLCYSISSSIVAFNGLMLITTSLDERNIARAIDLITKQVQRLKHGDFEESLIEGAKQLMFSNFDSIEDDEFSILSFVADARMLNNPLDKDYLIDKYSKVDKEMILEAVKDIELVLTYTMKGNSDETVN